jgi:hypothetical protein
MSAALVDGEIHAGVSNSVAADSGLLRLSAGGGTTVGVKAAIDIARGSSEASQIRLYTAGTERIRLNSTGNVGIGTSSPTQKLSIQGAAFVGASFNGQIIGDSTAERIRIGYKNGTPDAGLVPAQIIADTSLFQFASRDIASGAITFATGTGIPERLRITSAGNVGIGTSSPSASAILDAQSTTKGVRMPNMTTTEKNAIASPAAGLMVYDTTLAKLCVYTTAWETITSL